MGLDDVFHGSPPNKKEVQIIVPRQTLAPGVLSVMTRRTVPVEKAAASGYNNEE
jgi:hypothetical protein